MRGKRQKSDPTLGEPPSTRRRLKMTLETVPNDLDDAAHARMDEMVLDVADDEPSILSRAAFLLATIVSTSEGLLDSKYEKTPTAKALLQEYPELLDKLRDAWKDRTFREIRNLRILQTEEHVRDIEWPMIKGQHPNLKYFEQAFKRKYEAPFPDILLTTMDLYAPSKSGSYYNRSFPIVQSSGMGKSRLVDHSAASRFTFPFNLHEDMEITSKSYPPFDEGVRDYLTASFKEEVPALTRHFTFLEALFSLAVEQLQNYDTGTPAEVALAWYKWMGDGATETSVGTNRAAFYHRVVAAARNLEQQTPADLEVGDTTLEKRTFIAARTDRLTKAAHAFCNRLTQLHGPIANKFFAIVSFDEAHTLQRSGVPGRNPYFALMHVLSTLVENHIFFIFLSTNSSLSAFAPTDSDYPSVRVQKGSSLIPPFFELPFDVFCRDFTLNAKRQGKLTLNGVCELEQVVKFGRSMWKSHFETIPETESLTKTHPTISLAMLKLCLRDFPQDDLAQLAALDSRVLIRFDPIHSNSRGTQALLVRSKMRVVFNIPTSREFMWSGYPSEPILAEAAARLLNNTNDDLIMHVAPRILESALTTGLLARGERGELIARTLLTVAHDRAITYGEIQDEHGPRFHRPVRLVDVLEHLVSPDIWTIVRAARPFHAYPGDRTLEEAFSDAWANFSHFVQLGDHASYNLQCASELLKCGAAIQTFDNQYNMDIAVPFHYGDPEKLSIAEENTGVAQVQVKNTLTAATVFPEPLLPGASTKNLPIISLIMQLGVEKNDNERVTICTADKDPNTIAGRTRASSISLPDDIKRRHYVITLFGCTSKTYRCIPEDSKAYCLLLRAQPPFLDFPRAGSDANQSSLYALKPMIYNNGETQVPWST